MVKYYNRLDQCHCKCGPVTDVVLAGKIDNEITFRYASRQQQL